MRLDGVRVLINCALRIRKTRKVLAEQLRSIEQCGEWRQVVCSRDEAQQVESNAFECGDAFT